jgi:hypothetical protein
MATLDEDALYEELRLLPDFECFPLPAHWYKKYNIEPVKQPDTREFLNSHYTIKCAIAPKDLPPIIINEPQQNGKLYPLAPPPDIPVYTITRPLQDSSFVVHPSLNDDSLLEAIKNVSLDDTPQQPVPTQESSSTS